VGVEDRVGTRLLVTSAGTGGSNNLIRSLQAGDPSLEIVGCHDDPFILKKSLADRKYLIPTSRRSRWARALRHIIGTEEIDLVIPTTDADVLEVSRIRDALRHRGRDRVFLPRPAAIKRCQDKYHLARFLRVRGLPAPATYPVRNLKRIDDTFRRLGRHSRVWCRIRRGTGSLGAIPVKSPEQARSWIEYWREMRGVPPTSFALSEYLPGRDLGCQSLWKDGRLVLIKTYERLSYLGTGSQPSQISSVAALAKTVVEPRVVETCRKAVAALDRKASGIFSIDLREDARGVACITEVNVGRFSSATTIFDLAGKYNMAVTFVLLALGEVVDVRKAYDAVEDFYMLRDLDAPPDIFHADDFFDGIRDARR
jgi:carbamoyl-phosphate synthase large subunit